MTIIVDNSMTLLDQLWLSSEEYVTESAIPYGSKMWHERGGSSASAVKFCRSWAEKVEPVALNLEAVITHSDPRDWVDLDEPMSNFAALHEGDVFPLSEPQLGALMATEIARGNERAYGFYATFECDQSLDEVTLRQRYASLLEAHAALTIHVIDTSEGPKQRVRNSASLLVKGFRVHRTSSWKNREDLVRHFGRTDFDVRSDPLFAWDLVIAEDGRSALVHSEHHLVHDGRSFERIIEELQLLETGHDICPEWHMLERMRNVQHEADTKQIRAKEDWAGYTTGHQLAGRLPWAAADQAPYLRLPISPVVRDKIAALAVKNGVSEFELWYAVFTQAAMRILGSKQVVSATSVAGRGGNDYDSVGMYVRMSYLPLTTSGDTEEEIVELARAVRRRRSVSLDQLQDIAEASGRQERSSASLAAISFNSHTQQSRRVVFGGIEARLTAGVHVGGAKFAINGVLIQHSETGEAELVIEGQASVVSAEDLWTLWSLTGRTWRKLLGFGGKSLDRERTPTRLESRIRDYAQECGDWIALESETVRVSYEELEAFAGRARRTFLPGDHVVVVADASPAHYALAYAIMSSGGWYVPIDPQKGNDYIRNVVDSLNPDFVIEDPGALLEADRAGEGHMLSRLRGTKTGDETCAGGYIIFTSGTTKAPRGVRVPKHQLSLHCPESSLVRDIRAGQRVSQIASPGFDASGYEVWPTLFAGATVRFIPPKLRYDIRALREYVKECNIDHLFLPTPLGELFLTLAGDAHLQTLSVGGDRLHDQARPAAFPLINSYGPTENVIACSLRRIEAGDRIDGAIAHCLRVHTESVLPPCGDVLEQDTCEGELWVGGVLASEYVDNALETARKFVPLPGSDDLSLMHRTGDLVSVGDGGIRVLGRIDRQVKVGGNRLNLDPVEDTLTAGIDWLEAAHVDIDPVSEKATVTLVGQPPQSENWRQQLNALLPPALRGSKLVISEGNFNLSGKREWKGAAVGQTNLSSVKMDDLRYQGSRDDILLTLVGALQEKDRRTLELAVWAEIKRQVLE